MWLQGSPTRARAATRPGSLLATALSCALILCLGLHGAPAGAAENGVYRGRSLTEVLAELQERGLNLIYSTAVVSDDLVVTVEPEATELRALLDEILAPLGLEARRGPGRALLIVKAQGRPATGMLKGRVVSSSRGAPVVRATVTVLETGAQAGTRPDGTFEIEQIPFGVYTITVKAPWFFERTLENIRVSATSRRELEVALEAQPGYVEEIVVTPSRYSLVQHEQVSTLALTSDDAVLVPTIGGDITRVIEGLPGVSAPDNSAVFNVRGGETRDVSLVLDGLELYEPFHLQGFQSPFSFIDTDIVERIDFLRGGFTADSGDRHGGFVRLSTRTPDDPYKTRIELGTLRSRASYAAPLTNGALLLSGRAWYPEALGALELGEDELDPRFQDVYIKYLAYVSPKTVFSAHALAARDRLSFTESDGAEQVTSQNESGYVWVRALRSWSSSVISDMVLSGGRLDRSRRGISEPEDDPIVVNDDRKVDFLGLKHDLSWEISSSHLLKAGFALRPLEADYRYELGAPGATTTTRLDPSGTSLALHIAHRAAISDNLVTEVGLRWDQQDYTDDRQLSPRFNALWRLGERSEMRLGLGHFYQSQRIYELRLEDGETTFLPAELSRQAEVTFQHRFRSGLGLQLDTYYRRLSDVHPRSENLFSPLELFPETEADRIVVAPQRARSWGAEALLRGAAGRPLSWWVGYAWSSAEDVIDGADVPRSWDQTHAANFLVAYRWGEKWSLSLSGAVHTGWPTTPVSGREVMLPDGSTEIEPVLGPRNSDRFSTYARLDVKLGRSIPLSRSTLRLYLQITNLTDRNNECCVDEFFFAPQPDGRVETRRAVDHWRRFTPAFSAVWEF